MGMISYLNTTPRNGCTKYASHLCVNTCLFKRKSTKPVLQHTFTGVIPVSVWPSSRRFWKTNANATACRGQARMNALCRQKKQLPRPLGEGWGEGWRSQWSAICRVIREQYG